MIDLPIHTQPDDETCGPTSLHGVYRYYHDEIKLNQVLQEVERLKNGGTFAALLGKHALQRGYKACLYAYNLDIFDPSWFKVKENIESYIHDRLIQQLQHKKSLKIHEATQAYISYIENGGIIKFKDLTANLLKRHFMEQTPILTGLSATYLYDCARERYNTRGVAIYDDLRGEPSGHFVVLCGYDEHKRHVVIADPHRENPISHNNYYKVHTSRLINAIMLGVLTYDANLLVIKPAR